MIQLNTGQTLSAKAGTNNVLTCSIFGDLITTTDNFAPVQALIPLSVGTIYTSTGGQTIISGMHIVNTTALDVTGVTFYIIGTAGSNQITNSFTIPASGWATYAQGVLTVYNAAGLPLSVVSLSTATPQPLGVASAGTSSLASRDDHVHVMPRLDQVTAPNTSVSMNSQKLQALADGASPTDAINLGQLTAAVEGRKNKDPVLWATTGNITLSGLGTQANGEWTGSLTAGDRILAKDQTTSADKGIYIAAAGAWTRATDANTGTEITQASVLILNGATLVGDTYTQTATVTTIGTDPQTWVQTGEGETTTADNVTLERVGNQFREKDGGTSNAKLATMGDATFKMRALGAGTGAPIDGTPAQAKTALAITGSDVANTPSGNIAATTVQTALNELDNEKVAAPAGSVTDQNPAVFDGTSGKLIKQLTYAVFTGLLSVVSTAAQGVMSVAQLLRLTSQHRNLMSDVPGGVNVKADGIYRLDATMASGTQIINSAGATFTAADVGKICGMNGVGAGGQTVYGTITARNSATQITVDFQATTTVAANGVFIYGTDDLTALNAAIASGGRWEMTDWNEVNDLATRMLLSNAPNPISQTGTQIRMSGGIANYDVGFNERGNFVHIMRSTNPNASSLTLGRTQLTSMPFDVVPTTGASNQALKGIRLEGFTVECAGNVPMGLRARSSHKGFFSDIHVKNPAYRAYDFTTVGGQLGEATDYSKNNHERLSARCLDGSSASTTANGAVANLFLNANLVLTSAAAFQATGGAAIAMTTINGAIRPTFFTYTGISGSTLTGITCLFTIAGQSAALANLAVVVPAGPFFADGFVGDGDPNSQNASAGNAPGNTSLNVFMDCGVVHANGMARRYLNADSNKFINFAVNRSAGATGVGCGYFGSSNAINTARNNMDLGGDPGAGGAVIYGQEMTGITANPLANRWYDYELGNGAPRPVNGVGAPVTTSDFLITYNGGLTPALSNRGTAGATGNAATVGGAGAAGATGVIPGMYVIMPPQGPAVGTSGEFLVGLGKGAAGTSVQLGMNYGVANTAADASTGVGTAWTGTAVADEIWLLVTWSFKVIGGSALITARTIPLRRQVDAAVTGWVTTVAAYKALHTWTEVAFNSALANPGPAYLSLQVRANTGTVVSVLPGSVAKINVA